MFKKFKKIFLIFEKNFLLFMKNEKKSGKNLEKWCAGEINMRFLMRTGALICTFND